MNRDTLCFWQENWSKLNSSKSVTLFVLYVTVIDKLEIIQGVIWESFNALI